MIRALILTISTLALAMLPAIAGAASVAVKMLDMENEIGRIAVGYSADLIAIDGNPLDDAHLLEKIYWVMVRGRIIN
ncbi:amidohydrolase family protein [Parasphingorhabdus sp.]|uniref:amidohydrolase family protein n=1 Tax=Parasphingorhabdus sp. TaxID=2709688 RepID=UPI0030B60DB7